MAVAQHLPVGNQQLRMAVAQHEVQSLCGIGGVERHVGAARRQYAYGGNGEPLVAWYQDAHHVVGGQPRFDDPL